MSISPLIGGEWFCVMSDLICLSLPLSMVGVLP